jgi:hypothetical protein
MLFRNADMPRGDELLFERIVRWRNVEQHVELNDELAKTINILLATIEYSHDDYNYDALEGRLRFNLKSLAVFLRHDVWQGSALSNDETFLLISTLLHSKSGMPQCEEIVANSAAFILNYPYRSRGRNSGIEETKREFRAAIELTAIHNIQNYFGNPYHFVFLLRALEESTDYAALPQDMLSSPVGDDVMNYFVSSSDTPQRKAAVAVEMLSAYLHSPRIENWHDIALPFSLSDEQTDAVNEFLADIELSQRTHYDFNAQNGSFRIFLKALAAFLMSDKDWGSSLSAGETAEQIQLLLASKNNMRSPGREEIICNSASFIMSFPYKGDPANPDKLTADYREAFALAKTHDISETLLAEFSELRQTQDYMNSDEDLLAYDDRNAVMAYLVSSDESARRKAAVAMVMMRLGLPADEAAVQLDTSERAARVSGWARVMPNGTEMSVFTRVLQFENVLHNLSNNSVSLLDAMATPLAAFTNQGFSADQSFECLKKILMSWHSDPLEYFMNFTPSDANTLIEPWLESIDEGLYDENIVNGIVLASVGRFPGDFITRLTNNGFDPDTVSALLVFFRYSILLAQKQTVAILQAAEGALTLEKLQALVPYLNESNLPPTQLINIAQAFLADEAELAELEQRLTGAVTEGNEQNSLAVEKALLDLMTMVKALRVPQNIYDPVELYSDRAELYLDVETAETTFITDISGSIGRQHAVDWRAARNCTAKMVINDKDGIYTEFSCNKNFSMQFPGQAGAQPYDTPRDGYNISSNLPPGTTIIMDSINREGEPRSIVFRLPPIK